MTPRPSVSRFSRLVLLIAALLQLAGSAVGPWAHAVNVERAAASQSAQGSKKAPAPVHDERDCAVCQAFSAAPLPAEPPLLPFVALVPDAPLLAAGTPHAAVAPAPANARAPPAVPA